ncbi:transposase [Arenibacter certesii]|uniref:Transposase n=1 Tax=Arenibacter certesii TaxID=228955 RepID=A0A918IX13_9FLAO|nr:transposase [Arenibacter certesii]GGW36272.1 transposase [Arenibacter certesii]
MKRPRGKFSSSFNAKVAIEAINEQSSLQEVAAKFVLHPNQISNWKRELLENADLVCGPKAEKENLEPETGPLYSKIGQLQVENDFLMKSLGKCALPREGKWY